MTIEATQTGTTPPPTVPPGHFAKLDAWLKTTFHLRSRGCVVLELNGAPITAYLAVQQDQIGHTFMLDFEFLTQAGRHCVDSHELCSYFNSGTEHDLEVLQEWHSELISIVAMKHISKRGLNIISLMLQRFAAANPSLAPSLDTAKFDFATPWQPVI